MSDLSFGNELLKAREKELVDADSNLGLIQKRLADATEEEILPLAGLGTSGLSNAPVRENEIKSLLATEGQADWLPAEFQENVDRILTITGSKATIQVTSREELKKLVKELAERSEWLDNSIKKTGTADFPKTTTRDDELAKYASIRGSSYADIISFTTLSTAILGGIPSYFISANVFNNGWAFLPVLAAFTATAFGIGNYLFNRTHSTPENIVKGLEKGGEAEYQEPINAKLLDILGKSEERTFESKLDKAAWIQDQQVALYRGLKSMRLQVEALSLDCKEMLNDFEIVDTAPLTINNEKQVLDILTSLEQTANKPNFLGDKARQLSEALKSISNGEQPTNQIDDKNTESIIRRLHLIFDENRQSERVKDKLDALVYDTAAKAEL